LPQNSYIITALIWIKSDLEGSQGGVAQICVCVLYHFAHSWLVQFRFAISNPE